MAEIPPYKFVFRAYLEASAIRRRTRHSLTIFFFSGVPCEFAEGAERVRDNFQLSFCKHSSDRRIFPWLPRLVLSVARKQNRARQYINTGRQPLGKWRRGNASTRIIWPAVRRDVRARRRNETRRPPLPPPKSTNSINTPALISVIERVFRVAGIRFPQIVPDAPTPSQPARTTGETLGKLINDAMRDEKNFLEFTTLSANRSHQYTGWNGFGQTGEQRIDVKFYRGARSVFHLSSVLRIPGIIFEIEYEV